MIAAPVSDLETNNCSALAPNGEGHSLVVAPYEYFSVLQLLTTPFVLVQLAFNAAASFGVPSIGFAWVVPDKSPYTLASSNVISVILVGPMACALLCSAFLPVGMADAIARGWFGGVKHSSLPKWG